MPLFRTFLSSLFFFLLLSATNLTAKIFSPNDEKISKHQNEKRSSISRKDYTLLYQLSIQKPPKQTRTNSFSSFPSIKDLQILPPLNIPFSLTINTKNKMNSFLNKYKRVHLPKFLTQNWFLAIQNWKSIARYYKFEIAQAQGREKSFLLGLFRPVKDNSKIGFGYLHTNLSDHLTGVDYSNQGLFINFILRY